MRYVVLLLALGGLYGWQHQAELRLAWQRAQPGYEAPPVVLLATTWCGYCRKMREYFADEGIAYTEFDVETDAKGREWYRAVNGSGVPVVVIGAEVIHGYNPEGVSAALALQ